MVGGTASVGGVGVFGVGMVVNGADMDLDGVGKCGVGTGAGDVNGFCVQGVGEVSVGAVVYGRGRRRNGRYGHGYG